MKFLIEWWPLLVALFAVIVLGGYFLYVFIHRPTSEQLKKVREWLLYAVTEAEREFGSKTGQIKLRYVYDMFIAKFPYMVAALPFDSFSLLVDEALEKFRKLLESNTSLTAYVEQGAKVSLTLPPKESGETT